MKTLGAAKWLVGVIVAFAVLTNATPAFAATLSLTSVSAKVVSGDIVTVKIKVDAGDQAINTAEGTLQFPVDTLDALSVDKSSSIFSIWVENPSFSNQSGEVSFSGGLPSPGYSGAGGTVLSITFRAKRAGVATLSLAGATVRANDGLGTNVLTSATGLQLTVTDAPLVQKTVPPAPAPAQAPAGVAGAGVVISSATHPDQAAWYADQNPTLAWSLPADATMVEAAVSSRKGAVPSVLYDPAIAQKELTALADGVWYFNVRARTANGWGPVTAYELNIDTTAPTISSPQFSYDAATGTLSVSATANDSGSGIAGYGVRIDSGAPTTIDAGAFVAGAYRLAVHTSGGHTAWLAVIDKAGNRAETSGTFVVPAIAPPTIESIPAHIDRGSQLSVRGTAPVEDAQVRVYLAKDGGNPDTFLTKPDDTGSFTLLGPVLQNGSYEVWAEGISGGGIVSTPTEKMPIKVEDAAILQLGSIGITLPVLLVIILLFSFGSFIAAVIGWYKVYTYSRRYGTPTPMVTAAQAPPQGEASPDLLMPQ